MTEARRIERHAKVPQQGTYRGAARPGGASAMAAGRTAYREEFQRDYGPDLDEALDGTESGHEF